MKKNMSEIPVVSGAQDTATKEKTGHKDRGPRRGGSVPRRVTVPPVGTTATPTDREQTSAAVEGASTPQRGEQTSESSVTPVDKKVDDDRVKRREEIVTQVRERYVKAQQDNPDTQKAAGEFDAKLAELEATEDIAAIVEGREALGFTPLEMVDLLRTQDTVDEARINGVIGMEIANFFGSLDSDPKLQEKLQDYTTQAKDKLKILLQDVSESDNAAKADALVSLVELGFPLEYFENAQYGFVVPDDILTLTKTKMETKIEAARMEPPAGEEASPVESSELEAVPVEAEDAKAVEAREEAKRMVEEAEEAKRQLDDPNTDAEAREAALRTLAKLQTGLKWLLFGGGGVIAAFVIPVLLMCALSGVGGKR